MLHMFTQVLFWAGNQGDHQNVDSFMLTKKLWLICMGMNQKILFFLKKIIQNDQLKKIEIFKTANS